MINQSLKLRLLTPLFSRGSYDTENAESAEIRAPSIRGQLHHWFRQLGGLPQDEAAIFGSVHQNFGGSGQGVASKIVVRVSSISGARGTPATLPHKSGGQSSPKAAYLAGTTFVTCITERLGGIPSLQAQQMFSRSLEAWLLLGSLGLRSTRAAGAFQWDEAPLDPSEYHRRLETVIGSARLRFDILKPVFTSAEEARKVATDTINHQALIQEGFPLGAVKQGERDQSGAPKRKTSPLRLTIRQFHDGFRLLATWDGRYEVTGNTPEDLMRAITKLAIGTSQSTPKQIGKLLQGSRLASR